MSDPDRGAYTPQPDAPLQFDARGPRARRPMPMTLIGSAAVLVVVLGALALHYRHDTKADAPRPVGEPIAQLKSAAPAEAQPKDPNAGVDVFGGAAKSAPPSFAPPPEAPKPRAQLTVQAVDQTPVKGAPLATTAPPEPAKAAPAAPAPAAPAKTTLAKAGPVKFPVVKPDAVKSDAVKPAAPIYRAPTGAVAAKPDATAVIDKLAAAPATKTVAPGAGATAKSGAAAKPAAPAKTAAAASGSVVVQIGAFSSTALADKGFSDVAAAMGGDMAGKSKRVEPLARDGKTLYRTSVAGFPSRAAADGFCKSLAAKGKICFVKG